MSSDINPKHHRENFDNQHHLNGTGHGDFKFHHQMHQMSAEEHRHLWAHTNAHNHHSSHVLHEFHIHDAGSHGHLKRQDHHIPGHETSSLHHKPQKAPVVHPESNGSKPEVTPTAKAQQPEVAKVPLGPHDYQLPPGFVLHFSQGDKATTSANSRDEKASADGARSAPEIVGALNPHDAAPGVEASKKDILNQSSDLPERLMKAVALNEGTYTTVTKNDMHRGLSVGIRQWNQKGELPALLHDWHEKDPAKFDQIFGKYSRDAMNPDWVYHARHLGYDKNFMGRMNSALADPEFQQVQVENSKHFAQQAVDRARSMGLHSELGAAVVADFQNQMGGSGSAWAFRRVGLHEGGEVKNEAEVLQKLGKITRRPNAKARMEELTSIFSPQKLIDSAPVLPRV